MTQRNISFYFTCILLAGIATVVAVAQDGKPVGTQGQQPGIVQGEQPSQDGRAVSRAYLAGMESGDLDALTALFLTDDRSSILENASDEGSWEHYRDHHLAPEMDVAQNFRFAIAEEAEERFGDTILVKQTGTFTVDVRGETRHYRVAVSYLMVVQDDELRIAHLHWSSRPAPKSE